MYFRLERACCSRVCSVHPTHGCNFSFWENSKGLSILHSKSKNHRLRPDFGQNPKKSLKISTSYWSNSRCSQKSCTYNIQSISQLISTCRMSVNNDIYHPALCFRLFIAFMLFSNPNVVPTASIVYLICTSLCINVKFCVFTLMSLSVFLLLRISEVSPLLVHHETDEVSFTEDKTNSI